MFVQIIWNGIKLLTCDLLFGPKLPMYIVRIHMQRYRPIYKAEIKRTIHCARSQKVEN